MAEEGEEQEIQLEIMGEKTEKRIKVEDEVADEDWDYVLVFSNMDKPTSKGAQVSESDSRMIKWKEIQEERKKLVKHLRSPEVGLWVTRKRSVDRKTVFLLITAPQDRLEAAAEQVDLKMKQKPEFGGTWVAFEQEYKWEFETNPKGLFKKLQKISLIEYILEGDADLGGAGLHLDRLQKDKIISAHFPMADDEERQALQNDWASPKKMFSWQPIDRVRDYFGEHIALYFAWTGFYTSWLWIATIVGVVATIFWTMNALGDFSWASWGAAIYAIFLSLWATLFLEYWKRYNNQLNHRWGTLTYVEKEKERPEYIGEPMLGVYSEGIWVPLEPDEKYDFELPPKQKYYPSKIRRAKVVTALPIIGVMVTSVVIATFAVLTFRLFVQKSSPMGGAISGATLNAIVIMIANNLWKFIAVKLTNWENHRTENEYENHLIFKIFVFYFVNSYTSLYYIAFFKNGFFFFGDRELVDECKNEFSNPREGTIARGCVDELMVQLLTILLVNMFIGQTREVGIPYIKGKLQILRVLRASEDIEALPPWERDSKKPLYPGTLDEYSELVIQYGYITLFAASFPLTSLLAVLNNMVEIRTDAFKTLTAYSRPGYRASKNIGTWYEILEVVGVLAVITNSLLIGLTFGQLTDLVGNNPLAILGISVIIEHLVLFTKFCIGQMVPDFPGHIKKIISREEFIHQMTLKKIRISEGVKKDWSHNVRNQDAEDDAKNGNDGSVEEEV